MILTSCQTHSVQLNPVHSDVSCGILNAACGAGRALLEGEGGASGQFQSGCRAVTGGATAVGGGAVTGGWKCGWGWCWGMGMPFG